MLTAASAVPKAADEGDAAEEGGGDCHQGDADELGEVAEVGRDRLRGSGFEVRGRGHGLRGGCHERGWIGIL
jgi:hypothetical protein